MTTDLVGPLPTIRFVDGSRIAYQPPRNTLDNRYPACRNHHPACDCREAEWSEQLAEHRAEIKQAHEVANEVLRGHVTYAYTVDGEIDYARRCQCTGCQISRICWILRRAWDQQDDGVPLNRPADWQAPR